MKLCVVMRRDGDSYHLLNQARSRLEVVWVDEKFDLTIGRSVVRRKLP